MSQSSLVVTLLALVSSAEGLVLGPAARPPAPRAAFKGFERPIHMMARKDDGPNLDAVGSNKDFGTYRRIEGITYLFGGIITIGVPIILGIWAYNEGYLTPQ